MLQSELFPTTFASGGTFSQYSHEFQTITSAGEDIIHICHMGQIAVNNDLIKEQKYSCPECGNKDLRQEKAIEVGNIFPLKTRFPTLLSSDIQTKRVKKELLPWVATALAWVVSWAQLWR